MRWPTPRKSPKMSWRNSRRPLQKLVSHSEEGTTLLSAVHLKWIYPSPVSSGASRMWAVCCSRDLLHAKESLGSLVASGLSLLAKEHKERDSVAVSEHWQTALSCCSRVGFVGSWWQKKYPNRYCITSALAVLQGLHSAWFWWCWFCQIGWTVQMVNIGAMFLVCAGVFEALCVVSL